MSPNPTRIGEKYSVPFDLYDEENNHWGQCRLAQYGGATLIQVQVDRDGLDWQDFQTFIVLDNKLHYGVVGKRPNKG
jgi:hypothetical protein